MKKSIIVLIAGFAGGAWLGLAGCSKQERADAGAKARELAQETKTAVAEAWGDVKAYTFEKRDDFSRNAQAMSARMDAQLSELRANYSEAQASASRQAAMAELKSAESDYKAKLAALGQATADTWQAAKDNVVLAWDRLEASYRKARAE
ncbi:MAG: hypothetical protein JNG83_02520 [Opitutaceae bacterium]|nr:hypothetical protein [Opitutaceae bacterium]